MEVQSRDVQVVPPLPEMVAKGKQVQIDTGKHKGAIDYEVLDARDNAPLRIQEDHQESSAQATPGIEDTGKQRQEATSETFEGITPIVPPYPTLQGFKEITE